MELANRGQTLVCGSIALSHRLKSVPLSNPLSTFRNTADLLCQVAPKYR